MQRKELSIDTKRKLGKLLMYTGEAECRVEFGRQSLCKTQAFEPYASFQRMDRAGKGFLSARDIAQFMRDNGQTKVSDMCCRHLVKFFDSTGEGRLHYSDYMQIVLPCDAQVIRAQATQRHTYTVQTNEFLPYDVERNLTKLMDKELKLAGQIECLKQELACSYDYNLDRLYNTIDDCHFKFIDTANLKRYLVKCGLLPTDAILIAIIRRLDLDADARLSQKEFFDGVQPLENYTKMSLDKLKKSQAGIATANTVKRKRPTILKKQFTNVRPMTAKPTSYNKLQQEYPPELDQETFKHNYLSDKLNFEENKASNRCNSPIRDCYAPDLLRAKSPKVARHQDPQKPIPSYNQMLDPPQLPKRQTNKQPEMKQQINNKDQNDCMDWLHTHCFREILLIEGQLERQKADLASQPNFSLEEAFLTFAGDDEVGGPQTTLSKRLGAKDMCTAFERMGLSCDLADAKLVTARYDADEDGRLSYWEFANMFLPVETKYRDDLEYRRPITRNGMDQHTKSMMKQVLRVVLNSESMIENIRQRAKQNILLPHREIFNSLDWMGRGFLTCQEIRKFFSSFPHSGISVCPEAIEKQIEIEAFIRRFNKDKLSGKISLPEFLDELTPKEEEKRY